MRRAPFLSTACLAALVIAGCGSSSSSSSSSSTSTTTAAAPPPSSSASSAAPASSATASGGGGALTVAADPQGALKFSTTSLTATAGSDKITFVNQSPVGHNLTIADANGAVVGASPTFSGSSKTVSVTLKPGTYTYYCSVPGHRAAGMQGTLTVK
jgi:plastocyanin